MIKRMAVMLLMLFLTIAVLVGYQWFIYELNYTQLEKVQTEPIDIDVTITHKDGLISIEQKVSNLMQSDYEIILPQQNEEIQCTLIDGELCNVVKEGESYKVDAGSHTTLYFTYSFSIENTMKSLWLEEWFVQFIARSDEKIPMNFEVMLSEENKSLYWVAGALEKGRVAKEHIQFYVWTKADSTNFPLYMTNTELHKIDEFEPKLYIYAPVNSDSEFPQIHNWIDNLSVPTELTIIKAVEDNIYHSPHLIIVPTQTDSSVIEELILSSYLKNLKPPVSTEIEWVWDVLPAFILNRPVGTNKVYEMSKELLEQVPLEVKETFSQWLLEINYSPITIETLDNQLSLGSTLSTMFFSNNIDKHTATVPLYYTDYRSVFKRDEMINTEWFPIVRNQEMYFPIEKTMESLGFKVTVFAEERLFLILKNGNSWRFYLDKPYYIYNQEHYGLVSEPLKQLGDTVFIPEKWLERILKVDVVKRENGIFLM